MEGNQILLVGLGGLGCSWATKAWSRCSDHVGFLRIDADDASLGNIEGAHTIRLGHVLDDRGCAALPALAEQRMRSLDEAAKPVFDGRELVILLVGLGGGTGTGAAAEVARQARKSGAIVITVAALPFSLQSHRTSLANDALTELESKSHVCVQLSLDRLARRSRENGSDWRMGSEWVEDLVEGLVGALLKMGLINLDLMDLRSIVDLHGASTMIVGTGASNDADSILKQATSSPLADFDVSGAKGCLIQIEGGPDMSISALNEVADLFTSAVDDDAKVILGARVSPDLIGQIRVVTLLSGISSNFGV